MKIVRSGFRYQVEAVASRNHFPQLRGTDPHQLIMKCHLKELRLVLALFSIYNRCLTPVQTLPCHIRIFFTTYIFHSQTGKS